MMLKLVLAILIISTFFISTSAEFIPEDCLHEYESESSHDHVCDICLSLVLMIDLSDHDLNEYSDVNYCTHVNNPAFLDQGYFNGIDHPPRKH